MPEVWFYHLTRSRLEQALPDLLEKTVARGWRALVRAGSDERVEQLNTHLWTYNPASFLPHGSVTDGHADRQPILLTTGTDNANHAEVLFLVDGVLQDDIAGYARCVVLFDGTDAAAVAAARDYWKKCKAGDADVKYWQQGERGGWEEKSAG